MEEPNATAPRREGRSIAIRSLPLVVLMAIALLFVLRVARGLLIPITIAFILQALFTPLVQFFARRRIPQGMSAAVIVGAMLCLLGTATYYLRRPAQEWLEELPSRSYDLERKLRCRLRGHHGDTTGGPDALSNSLCARRERRTGYPLDAQADMKLGAKIALAALLLAVLPAAAAPLYLDALAAAAVERGASYALGVKTEVESLDVGGSPVGPRLPTCASPTRRGSTGSPS